MAVWSGEALARRRTVRQGSQVTIRLVHRLRASETTLRGGIFSSRADRALVTTSSGSWKATPFSEELEARYKSVRVRPGTSARTTSGVSRSS